VIPYDWNKFVSHVKILIIIISQMGVFEGDNYHFQIEDDKVCEVDHFLKVSFQTFFGD